MGDVTDGGGQVLEDEVQAQYQIDIPRPIPVIVTQFKIHIGHCETSGQRVHGRHGEQTSDATGAAARFLALATEYEKAPAVTRKRLYLETMEAVLPEADKLIVEPGSGAVLPYLPLGPGAAGAQR